MLNVIGRDFSSGKLHVSQSFCQRYWSDRYFRSSNVTGMKCTCTSKCIVIYTYIQLVL